MSPAANPVVGVDMAVMIPVHHPIIASKPDSCFKSFGISIPFNTALTITALNAALGVGDMTFIYGSKYIQHSAVMMHAS